MNGNSSLQLLRISEVADRLAISRSAAYRLCASGGIGVVMVGERSLRVTEEDLGNFVARNRGVAS